MFNNVNHLHWYRHLNSKQTGENTPKNTKETAHLYVLTTEYNCGTQHQTVLIISFWHRVKIIINHVDKHYMKAHSFLRTQDKNRRISRDRSFLQNVEFRAKASN